MKRLYPDTRCYQSGYLDCADGHSLYYEQSGNPQGLPVLFVHGGPGAGLPPNYKCFFDASRFRIIGFDQRGCGRSKAVNPLEANTTQHVLSDIQRLRQHLNISTWVLFGGSWGATLCLLDAIAHPTTVQGLILRGTFLGRSEDREWFLASDAGPASLFPDAYADFVSGIEGELCATQVCNHYQEIFVNGSEMERFAAAKRWYMWEERLSRLVLPPGTGEHSNHYPIPLVNSLATLECHYLTHRCFIEDNFILNNISAIQSIPGTIVHGRYDMICKTAAAYELNRAWPNAELQIVPDAGHSTSEPGIAYALCRATKEMARFIEEQKA